MKLDTKLKIQPYEGIGECRLGMTIAEIRAVLGTPNRTFRKSPTAVMPTDAFEHLGMHIFYKEPGVCEAIELVAPAVPIFADHTLIGQPFAITRDWLRSLDRTLEVDETGLTSYQLGISLYAPHAAEFPGDSIEAVMVFEQGYYDL